METEDAIYFYGHTGDSPYTCMSNFYPCQFVDDVGNTFKCSEQYFMYHKCLMFDADNTALLAAILGSRSPAKIKQFGRQVANFDNDVWSENRFNIMKEANILKFSQNDDIREILLGTNDKTLYEAAKNDKIWGIGYSADVAVRTPVAKYGQNLLGRVLMEIREETLP